MERKNKSPVWKVFIKDAAHKRTICTLCGKEFKYRYTTTNLRDHLKRCHPEWLPETGENSTATEPKIEPQKGNRNLYVTLIGDGETGRKNKSPVWQVFIKDAESKNVTCTLCSKDLKFWNNTTNLRAHLQRSHPEWNPEPRVDSAESGDETDSDEAQQEEIKVRRSSTSSSGSYVMSNLDCIPKTDSVWRVFVKDDTNKRVFCTLCQKNFSSLNNAWNMKDHLRRLHPDWEPVSETSPRDSDQENDEDACKTVATLESSTKSSFCVVNSDRKNRSPVWEVFIRDSVRKRTICMLCNKTFKCWNNTANLLDHLRRIHDWKGKSSVEDLGSDRRRPTIARLSYTPVTSISEGKSSHFFFSTSDLQSKRIDRLIGEMICLDFQNLCIVEDVGFKKLMKELAPNYNVPKRKTVAKETLPIIYDSVCKYIQEELEKCKYVAISTELWTNINAEAFATITVHYFANDEYTSSVLQTQRIHNDHSSEDLAAVMHKLFEHWNILDKITAIVADDDAAVKAACEMLSITHLPCIANVLNNVITEALTENDDAQLLLQRCQNLVAHFKGNPSACDVLHDIQLQMGHPTLSLKQVAPTRWNSALHMFQRLIDMKEPLTTTLVAMHEGPEPLASADWLVLEDFLSVLKPFDLMSSELSADSYCNISKVVPLIRGVQSSLQSVSCNTDLGAALKKMLQEKLDLKFVNYEKNVIPSVATLLDPRFKRAGLGVDSVIESTCNFVMEHLLEMRNSAKNVSNNNNATEGSTQGDANNSDIWNFLDEKVNELSSSRAPSNSIESSVTQYLDLPYLKRQDCPFRFWISQTNLEPELADVALKFMSIPATSFPADRLYSKAGVSINERRNRITSKYFDTLIFLNKNL